MENVSKLNEATLMENPQQMSPHPLLNTVIAYVKALMILIDLVIFY